MKNKEKTLELGPITRHKVLGSYRVTACIYSVSNYRIEKISLLTLWLWRRSNGF